MLRNVLGCADIRTGIKTAAAFTYGAEPTIKLLTTYVLSLQPTDKLSVGEIIQGMDRFYQDTPENAPVASSGMKPSEVLRYGQEPPESFTPHPLFRDEDTETHSDVTDPATKAASAGGKAE
jgi:hypothetical protein